MTLGVALDPFYPPIEGDKGFAYVVAAAAAAAALWLL